MKITEGQKAILLTCERDGLTNMTRIKKALPNYGSSLASAIRRGWLFDSSSDHGNGCFALTHKGGTALRQVLGREPAYNS